MAPFPGASWSTGALKIRVPSQQGMELWLDFSFYYSSFYAVTMPWPHNIYTPFG